MKVSIPGHEIAVAFNQQNDKKVWSARCITRGNSEAVYFDSKGIVSIIHHPDGRFAVKFNKFHAAWGDYIKAIARSMFVILNTLKSAGLPYDAPLSLAGMVIECETTETTEVYVRWPGQETPAPPPVDNSAPFPIGPLPPVL